MISPRAWRAFKWSLLARRDGYPDFRLDRLLRRQERLSVARLSDLRRRKTQRLVAECLKNVPYYGDLLRAAGIGVEQVRGPEDLEVLPLLTKEIVRREKARLLNRSASPQDYYPHSTGGSSGTPLDFYRGRDYDLLAVAAANMRAWRRTGWRPGDPMVTFWMAHDELEAPADAIGRLRRRLRAWLTPPGLMFDVFDSSEEIISSWIERIRAQGRCFLYGYGSPLTLLAHQLVRLRTTLPGVLGIASTAEALVPSARAMLRQTCPGATIIDIYGSREVPGAAAECARGTMHLNTDLVHVEFRPDTVDPGRHRLVLTALDNTVFPFIRYDIGDLGSPLAESCPCGLPFPGMRYGVGRIVDSFITPSGRILYCGPFETLMYGIQGVQRYQFVQEAPDHIVISVIPTEGFGDQTRGQLSRVQSELESLFAPAARIEVRVVREIPPTRSGKHLYFISKVRNPLLGGENQTGLIS